MLVYQTPGIIIAYGDRTTSFAPQQFYTINSSDKLLACAQFAQASAQLQLKELAVVKQVHGTSGILVDESSVPYAHEGDYLITKRPGVGLAVATADCVPITLYDPVHKLLCMVHAGWRGSVAGIVLHAITNMSNYGKTEPKELQVFIGPCARICCYEVSAAWVLEQQAHWKNFEPSVIKRDGRFFFDQVSFLSAQLLSVGVAQDAITTEHAFCTVCTVRFCSYRRDKEQAQRQMTIACLTL